MIGGNAAEVATASEMGRSLGTGRTHSGRENVRASKVFRVNGS
jgi:hypothetical protein